MTDKARELLERALEQADYIYFVTCEADALAEEIRAYLAEPEVKRDDEPVATLDHNGNFKLLRMVGVTVGQPINLYERPAPQKPFVWLSDDEIIEAYKNTPVKCTLAYFIAGVRLAESKYNEEKQ